MNLLDVLGALAALPRGQAVKWRELRDFAFADDDDGEEGEFAWDQPFHHSVPAFPATRPLPTELLDDEVVPKEVTLSTTTKSTIPGAFYFRLP